MLRNTLRLPSTLRVFDDHSIRVTMTEQLVTVEIWGQNFVMMTPIVRLYSRRSWARTTQNARVTCVLFCSQEQNSRNICKTKLTHDLKTALRFQRSRPTAVNISRVTVNCFPFDVIVLAMLPAHGIWRETVSLLDVMWPLSSQWMDSL